MPRRSTNHWSQTWFSLFDTLSEEENKRLARGKSYKRRSLIENIEVSPGLLRIALAESSDLVVQLGINCFSDNEWEEIFETIMSQTALSATILGGEVPESLSPILLSNNDKLSLDCNCGHTSNLCKHIADACWAVADLFDRDPFMILLFRGQDREQTLSRIRERRSEMIGRAGSTKQTNGVESPRGTDPGTSAAKAYAKNYAVISARRLPRQPGTLITLAVAPPQDSGIEEAELRELVSDAARRAYNVVAGISPSQLHLDAEVDIIRRAANGDIRKISKLTKIAEDELANMAQAWRFGQEQGVWVTRNTWDPEESLLQPGKDAIQKKLERKGRVSQNKITANSLQLRLDQKNNWWKFTADNQLGWVLCSQATEHPAELLTEE